MAWRIYKLDNKGYMNDKSKPNDKNIKATPKKKS